MGAAQSLPDSIKVSYSKAKTDLEKVRLIMGYMNTQRSDTAFLSKVQELISYFNSTDEQVIADHLQLVANDVLAKTGDYTSALNSSLEILNRFEKKKDKFGMVLAMQEVSTAYYFAGDQEMNIYYGKKAAILAKEINNSNILVSITNNIATAYAQYKMPDSALKYAQQTVFYAKQSGDTNSISVALGTLGETYIARKEYDLALSYIRESFHIGGDPDDLLVVWNLNDFAQIFLETNRHDSARYYARRAITISTASGYKDQIQRAYEYLSRSYEQTAAPDSAFTYLRLAADIKDSLFSSQKTKQVQAINLREQSRQQAIEQAKVQLKNRIKIYSLIAGLLIFSGAAFLLYRNNQQKQKTNKVLQQTLTNLESTQAQLIQSEKMASLGQLTAGIAHEIQNPLNFVNNFSEVNKELLAELEEELQKGNYEDARSIARDVISNEDKINYHGKRADAIVKGMLQHSQHGNGKKEHTDINALADEYLRLSYHGLRAKDKTFNATIKTDLDLSAPRINVVPQDLGRVLLNLLTNAFYAVTEKKKTEPDSFEPTVLVSTKRSGHKIQISVKDNGDGIPAHTIDRIFEPFFTTKPTGQGTGLGLSLSYDIITKGHGGKLKVETKEGEGSVFTIELSATT
jgi:signal transduction histidine kinase